MHAEISTVAFRGINTIPFEVKVHIANGLPAMAIAGLADKAVAESRERVRVALGSIGLTLPPKRIAVNLAPADVVKEGGVLICRSHLVCTLQWAQSGRMLWPTGWFWVNCHCMAGLTLFPECYQRRWRRWQSDRT